MNLEDDVDLDVSDVALKISFGSFRDYAIFYLANYSDEDQERERENLWSVVHGLQQNLIQNTAEVLYGSRPEFKLPRNFWLK